TSAPRKSADTGKRSLSSASDSAALCSRPTANTSSIGGSCGGGRLPKSFWPCADAPARTAATEYGSERRRFGLLWVSMVGLWECDCRGAGRGDACRPAATEDCSGHERLGQADGPALEPVVGSGGAAEERRRLEERRDRRDVEELARAAGRCGAALVEDLRARRVG